LKKPIPRISTRGYFDLKTGKTIKNNRYFLYPKKSFDLLYGQKEITVIIHGLRNDRQGAVNKFEIAKRRLKQLGYHHPVIGFSYDANTKGAHLKKTELQALHAAQRIAQKNGKNLSQFIIDFKKKSPKTKIRLIGHSLGTQVILSTIENLVKHKQSHGIIEAVYFFGASIIDDVPSSKKYQKIFQKIIKDKIVNYFAPSDEVLKYAHENRQVINPLGLNGTSGKTISKYIQKKVKPKNHRFISYSNVLNSFP
jgi:esterase/lipase superfamily enzyme